MDYKILRLVSDNEDRAVWQAEVSNCANRLVAVKAYEDIQNRNFEVACYEALKPLQGSSIPELFDVITILIEDDPCKYGLVLSWIDVQDDADMKIPVSSLLEARAIVKSMHRLGVAHGDIKLSNMNFNANTRTLQIFDFSHAFLKSDHSTVEFSGACVQDLEALDEIISNEQEISVVSSGALVIH
jgi:serine/threonine protein kinase